VAWLDESTPGGMSTTPATLSVLSRCVAPLTLSVEVPTTAPVAVTAPVKPMFVAVALKLVRPLNVISFVPPATVVSPVNVPPSTKLSPQTPRPLFAVVIPTVHD